MSNNTLQAEAVHSVFTTEQLLKHWQGHRSLSRRVIEAFPEKELFTFSVGGMRPFAKLALEMIDMGGPGVVGLATDVWKKAEDMEHYHEKEYTKQELLAKWDAVTDTINEYWPQITAERLQETSLAFGQWENKNYITLLYFIDNEIHHRGQGYVYLRALGIEPPAFWDRP